MSHSIRKMVHINLMYKNVYMEDIDPASKDKAFIRTLEKGEVTHYLIVHTWTK